MTTSELYNLLLSAEERDGVVVHNDVDGNAFLVYETTKGKFYYNMTKYGKPGDALLVFDMSREQLERVEK